MAWKEEKGTPFVQKALHKGRARLVYELRSLQTVKHSFGFICMKQTNTTDLLISLKFMKFNRKVMY